MATEETTSTGTAAPAIHHGAGNPLQRHKVATEAAYEIESISRVLQRLEDTDDKANLLRGALLRIEALSGVIMSVTSGTEPDREIADMRDVVFGRGWRQQSEVSHA
ncbi:MAG TPA: hypothetical protein VIN03_01710 [Roseateles sp.]